MRHQFVGDEVVGEVIDVKYTQTNTRVADALTKATPLSKLNFYCFKIELI